MSWIFLAAGAQLINAVVALLDKYIVTDEKILPRPFVYAFYTCLISGAWVFVFLVGWIPFFSEELKVPSIANVLKPTLEIVALSFLSAYTFFIALVSMFTALRQADTSDVVPVIGAVSALGSFGFAYLFFEATLTPNFIWGIVLLASGTFLVSRFRFPLKVAMNTIHAGIFFALHFIAIKGLFEITTFDNGFFWTRIAFVAFALTLLLVPSYYGKITEETKHAGKKAGVLILSNKLLAGISTIMILKATDMGDVAVVQALGGLQFVFILLIGVVLGAKMPRTCGEEGCLAPTTGLQKVLFVAIITLGFLVLFYK